MNVLIALTFALTSIAASSFHLGEDEVIPRGRISNGKNAQIGQLPYMVGLYITYSNSNRTKCGGTLISNKWVLTAAHCIKNLANAEVYLGDNIFRKSEKHIVVKPQDIFAHASGKTVKHLHDIALIKIPAVNFTSNIYAANLPPEKNASYTGKIAVTAGWGRTSRNLQSDSLLRWGRQTVISTKACLRFYGANLSQQGICAASNGGVSACSGDSGGPLVLESERIVIGVISASLCKKPYPTIFTSVASHLPWIKSVMNNN